MRIVIGFRAAIALAATLVITFTRPDTASLGLAIFAGFALLQAAGSIALGFVRPVSGLRQSVAPSALTSLVAAVAAILALGGQPTAKLAAFQIIVMSYLVLTAAFNTYLASKAGFKTIEGREHLIAAGLAELFTLIYVVLTSEPLNASGFLGAYLALSAVHQGIWAASPTKAD